MHLRLLAPEPALLVGVPINSPYLGFIIAACKKEAGFGRLGYVEVNE